MIGEQRAGLSLVTQLVTRSEAEDPAALQVFQRFSRRALASLTENEDALDQGPHGLLKVHSFATSIRTHVTDLAVVCHGGPPVAV